MENHASLKTAPIYLDAAVPLVQPDPRTIGLQVENLKKGAVNAVCATVASIENARETVARLGRWYSYLRSADCPFTLTTTVQEVRAAVRAGRIALLLHFQGTEPLEDDLNLLDLYHVLGVRIIQLTYNARCRVGDGCTETHDGGLSDFGRQAIERMGELGMVIDLAHVGVRTSLEAIEQARGPVIVSHANARALCDNPRNLTDEQIRAVAATGGVIGACAFPAFVSRKPDPSLEDLLNHVDYLRDLVGVKHIGFGADYADETEEDYEYYGYDPRVYPRPPWVYPQGLRGFADIPNLAAGLRRRGYSEQETAGILGENFLRVFEQVWRE